MAKELDSINIVDHDLFELAAQGYSSLPVDDICYSDREQSIKEQALKYFSK